MISTETLPDHWKTGCSNAKRWIECPGSKYAVDDREPGDAALRGTLGHSIVEQLLDGMSVELTEDDQAVLDGMTQDEKSVFVDKVMTCFDFVQAERETLKEGDSIHLETKIKSERIPNHGGTIDVIIYRDADQSLHCIDFKFGSTPVIAAENYQIAAYLNLARQEFPAAKTFKGSIVQPAYRGVETADFPVEWLDEWIVKAAVAADPENMTRKADPSYCEFCPLLTECKEAAKLGKSAAEEFAAFPVEEPLTAERVERLEWLLMCFKMAATAAPKVSEMLKQAFDKGFTLVHHKVTSKTSRSWKEEAKADPALADFTELQSPSKVQKALKLDKKKFDEAFGGMLDLSTSRTLRVGSKPDASALDEFEPV
jgi:hypothetical protein